MSQHVSGGSKEEEGPRHGAPQPARARGALLPAHLWGGGCFWWGIFLTSSLQLSQLLPGSLLALGIMGCDVPCWEGTQGCHFTSAALSPQSLKAQGKTPAPSSPPWRLRQSSSSDKEG